MDGNDKLTMSVGRHTLTVIMCMHAAVAKGCPGVAPASVDDMEWLAYGGSNFKGDNGGPTINVVNEAMHGRNDENKCHRQVLPHHNENNEEFGDAVRHCICEIWGSSLRLGTGLQTRHVLIHP